VRLNHEEGPGRRDQQQAVWSGRDADMLCLGVWTEKRARLGEDAEPTLLHHRSTGEGLLGVYDGLGGSGARQAGATDGGRQVTNAFVASRLAHLAVQDWFLDGRRDGVRLDERLREVFEGARRPGGPKLRGTLTRELPTTIALIEYGGRKRHSVDVTARWAGDSRCYLLTSADGMRQLSRDDSELDDALETLVADQPMTNLVSAGARFQVNELVLPAVRLPCVLLCATDGFFNYVATPALFEYQLLNQLGPAKNMQHWGELLAAWVRTVASDDATLALVALGFGDFQKMRLHFADRWQHLDHDHWRPMAGLRDADPGEEQHRTALQAARRASWDRYRDRYVELMPARGSANGDRGDS
jgi:serine/threonine protein phosphatase PrpC